ncbi:MAG TPA: dephospho-CoA kinase [Aggregatilineales bacterium]|nr:dephospho-CoA kinase [Aggregatilineales bacterium]
MSKRWPGKIVIGLTGNIATGKSIVRRMLEHLGALGLDADQLAHRAMSPGAPAYEPVTRMFGQWVVGPDKQIDRGRLGRIVFSDPEALAVLEQIVHPVVVEVIDLLVRRARQRVVVIEAIKLFEAGLADDCDEVWVVDAAPKVQIRRLMEKRGLSEAEARARLAAQPPQSVKLARATRIINNGGSIEETYNQVNRALQEILVGEPEPVQPPEPARGEIVVRRATPSQARDIALFIYRTTGQALSRPEMMARFGEKAYMLATVDGNLVGLAGWQVENLITRIDEFIIANDAPAEAVVSRLAEQIEASARDLQNEISLLFLPAGTPDSIRQAVLDAGYEMKTIADLRVPDWREAAIESAPPGSIMAVKRLRADRVLKPI